MKEANKYPRSKKQRTQAVETAAGLSPLSNGVETDRQARNQAAIRLLREWMADDSGYDARVWPALKDAIKRDRLSYRKRFGD